MTPPLDSHSAFDAYDIVPASDYRPANDETTDRNRARLARKIGYGAGATLLVLLGVGVVGHYAQHREAVAVMETRQRAVPKVRVEPVKVTTAPRDLSLPGTTSAFEAATIYARQSGYIAERRVDIGAKVKAGDVLAVIAAPEVKDQMEQAKAQLAQMQAALKQAQAARTLAEATYKRTGELVAQGWASKQQGDQDRANRDTQAAAVNVAEANIVAQQAQVARLEEANGYAQVIAPFDGVITQRSIDTGNLVTADSTSGTALFSIAHTDVLRVQIFVPQDAAMGLKEGVVADVTVPEVPDRIFHGRVARMADSLQPGTRTMLVEVDIDNADNALTPGIYCTVKFEVPRAKPVMEIPAEALIFNKDGTQVAVFENGRAQIRKVSLAEDDGDHVDIATGLKPDDKVIVSLPVDLTDGAPVAVRDVKVAEKKS